MSELGWLKKLRLNFWIGPIDNYLPRLSQMIHLNKRKMLWQIYYVQSTTIWWHLIEPQATEDELIPETTKLYIKFILDGATAHNTDTHQVEIVVDPHIETEDSNLFLPFSPCDDEYIYIKVSCWNLVMIILNILHLARRLVKSDCFEHLSPF